MRARYLEGARAIAPIGVASFAFALSFGVLARTAGMGTTAPIVMSATTFGGSAQFAVASLLDAGGAAAAAIAAALMLNARYVPIGISVASSFEGPVWRRLLQAQLIVDESWAVALKRRGGFDVRVLLGAPRPRRRVPRVVPGIARAPADRPARARGCDPRGRDRARVDPVHTRRRADRLRRCGVPPRVPAVSTVWLCVVVVGAASILFKATGPVLLGRRELPAWLAGPVGLLAPAVLAALVVTQSVAGDHELVADPRLAGLAVGAVAVAVRAPLLVVIAVAATTAALIRLF